MAQGMHRDVLLDAGFVSGGMNSPIELPGAEVSDRILAGKQPAALEHLALRPRHPPPDAQALQQHRREHRVAILLSLALFDPQCHALTVDVAHLQGHHFIDAQSGRVGQGQRSLVLQVAGGGDQSLHFLRAQDHRQLARQMHRLHLRHQFRPTQGDGKEELQPADCRVERSRRHAVVDKVQLVVAQFLDSGGIR